MICEALCLTGLAGVPTEYFDANTRAGFLDQWKVDEAEYLAALLRRKTTPNGVFGCKTHFHQYRETYGLDQLPTFSDKPFLTRKQFKRINGLRRTDM